MTVGLIATDAAKISDDEAVGYDSSSDKIHIKIGNASWTDYYFSSGGETSFTVAHDDTTVEFVYYVGGIWYKWDSSQWNYSASSMHKTSGCERLAMKKGSNNYKVTGVYADTYTVTITQAPSNNEMKVKIKGTGDGGGGGVDVSTGNWYLYGHQFGGWTASTSNSTSFDGYDSDGGYIYKVHTVLSPNTTDSDYFRIFNSTNNKHYRPSSGQMLTLDDTEGIIVEEGSDTRAFGLYDKDHVDQSITAGTEVKICFNGSKVWVESAKQPVVSSLVLTATKYSLTDVNETTNFIARAKGLQTGVTNLTYKLFKADGTQVGSDVTVTDGSLTATFANVAPNVNMQGYYATVEETSGTTYKSVTSNETTVTNSNEAYKPDYLITFTSDVNGTVAAYDDEGNALTSGTSRIKEGRHVTFKATPASTSYRFKNWTGVAVTSGLLTDEGKTKSAVTLTVYSDITLQANFEAKGYAINAGNATNHNMKELSNGWYISTSTYGNGAYFKIRRLSDSKVTKPSDTSDENNGCSIKNREIKKDVASWETENSWNYNFAFHADTGNNSYYVVYDPKNDQVWLSYHEDAQYKIKVIAKDGTVRKDHATTTTSSFGDTKITVLSNPEGTTITPEDDQQYNSVYQAEKVELSAAQARQGVKLKIRTDVDQTNHSDYFVKGFDVNGGETQGVISQEFNADGTEKSSYTDKAKIDGGYNEFTIDIQGYEDSVIEITPIYYKKETVKGDNIRFIVDGFDGTVKENWDGNLACYAYGSNDSEPFGYYPGQPMVCIGGRYMAELPRNNNQTTGITLNNYVWDYTHAYYHLNNNDTSDDNIKAHNRQTYDYNEFKIINKIFSNMDEWPDEDIIFSFKYKETQAIANSNLGTAVYYTDSASDKQNTTYDYRTVANTINPANYTFENLTNFYGERVDLRGNLVDVDSNTHRYENPLLVISNGYDWNSVGKFATAWAIYEPANSTGNPGTYTLKEVIGGQGAIKSGTKDTRKNGSQSYLIDPDAEQMDEKYGWDTENSHFVVTLNNRPAMICYEYEVKSAYSNEEVNSGSDPLSNDGNPGYRSDGRWYYSNSTQMIKSHVLIEYRESRLDTYTRDYYQRDNIDYTVDGYDRTKNQGLSTGIRAYYSNSGTVSNTTSSYTNTLGCTEAAAITDGEQTFDLVTTPDLDGNYTFEGWYLLENGKYTFVSDEYEYSAEALTNDVFVARYVKAPSGIVNITHALTTDSTGKAPTKLQVSVVDANNTNDVKFAFEETTGGQIVNSTYIKYDASSPKALKITLTNTPDKYSVFDTFKENVTGTLTNLNESAHPSIATGATITTGPNNTCVIIIPINSLFDSDGNQTIKALPFFSKVDLIHRHYKVEFEYKSRKTDLKDDNSRMWGTQSYSVEGTITDSDYNSGYFDLTDDGYKKAVLSTKKAEFLAKICPYEENFKENITWDFNDAEKISSPTYSREDEDNDKVSYKVTANYSDDNIISYKFRFPFEYTGPTTTDGVITFTPTETTITVDGKEVTDAVMYIDPSAEEQSLAFEPQLIYSGENRPAAGKLIYQDWVSLNSIHNSAEAAAAENAGNETTEPVFVTAPEKLYKAVTVGGDTTYKEMQFKYWSIRPYTNTGDESEIYKKCYYKKFNFALYQDAEITAEYEEVPDTPAEPEEPEESGEPERITTYISHDQNSRTQWNDNYGTANTAYSNYTAADRIFVDFMVNYEYKGQTLKELTAGNNPDNVRVGVILVRTDELDTDDVKTNAQYKAEYETGDNIALHSAEADAYITKIMNGTAFTPAESTVCKKSGASVNVTALDNKNMMDYAYSYANISQSTLKPTEHKNYLYRAYSYLIYETTDSGGTKKHFVKSAPEYFTFYDIASISGEEIVRNS